VPSLCQELVDSDGVLGIGKGRYPVPPNPPGVDILPGDDEASQHEQHDDGEGASRLRDDHHARHRADQTKQAQRHLVHCKQHQPLPEKPADTEADANFVKIRAIP